MACLKTPSKLFKRNLILALASIIICVVQRQHEVAFARFSGTQSKSAKTGSSALYADASPGEALALLANVANLQQQLASSQQGEKPRLIPLVVADSGYSENSSVNVLCTVSQGHHESLTFDWFKDGRLLLGSSPNNANANDEFSGDKIDDAFNDSSSDANGSGSSLSSNSNSNGNQIATLSKSSNQQSQIKQIEWPKIEKHSDHSLMRISHVHFKHSGRYTCSAKNHFGSDSSSVNLVVNGK